MFAQARDLFGMFDSLMHSPQEPPHLITAGKSLLAARVQGKLEGPPPAQLASEFAKSLTLTFSAERSLTHRLDTRIIFNS
jgi:hypothetical protein